MLKLDTETSIDYLTKPEIKGQITPRNITFEVFTPKTKSS